MNFKTADLYDDHADQLSIATPGLFIPYGQKSAFYGAIATIKVHEDNVLVKNRLSQASNNQVLVVDGGGSLRCALLGDLLAQLAIDNSWAGVIINGCIRDSDDINGMNIGVKALGTHPAKSVKRGEGSENQTVTFAGVTFTPAHYVYSDADGIIVSTNNLLAT